MTQDSLEEREKQGEKSTIDRRCVYPAIHSKIDGFSFYRNQTKKIEDRLTGTAGHSSAVSDYEDSKFSPLMIYAVERYLQGRVSS